MIRYPLLVLSVCLATLPSVCAAQAQPPARSAEFVKLYGQWKSLIAKVAQLRTRYQTDSSADRDALQSEIEDHVEAARELLEPLTIAGVKSYVAAPNQDKELTDFLVGAVQGFIVRDDFEIAGRIAKILLDHQCDVPELHYLAGIAFFMTNDFDDAQKHLQATTEKGTLNAFWQRNLREIDQYREAWAREKALREAEAEAGDLPKVKLETTQGDIVLELFENEAPNTVANFVSLVESKYYDGLTFHRVIPGFMAQTGDPEGDGTGGPGYTIHDECRQENHRQHFRGSLSMAKSAEPDSGGSQFFITFVPTPHLDGKHTVFGRVVEGMRVLSKLQRNEGVPGTPGPPDKIVKATVLSKRPHAYRPIKRVAGS